MTGIRSTMRRCALGAVAASAIAVGAADGQISACTGFFNNNFSSGSAFWPVDIQTGGWGDSFGGVFASFSPLSLVPASQANAATFFTEAFAAGDCEAPLGSAHNSQFILGRTLTSVPSSGRLRIKFGAQISYVLVNQSTVQFELRVIVRNLTTGQEAKCKVAGNADKISNGQVKEGIFTVPFQTYNPCACATGGLYSPGQVVEILAIGVVQANANSMGQSAFIGGPFFFDDFEFCNIFCIELPEWPEPIDPIIDPPGDPIQQLALAGGDLPNLSEFGDPEAFARIDAYQRALKRIDSDGDGIITEDEWLGFGLSVGGVPAILSATPDLNRDGVIDQKDVDRMIDMINGATEIDSRADLNGDGRVDGHDLEIMLDAIR